MLISISSTLKASARFTPGTNTHCFEVNAYLYLPCTTAGHLRSELARTGVWAFNDQLDTFWGDRGKAGDREYRYRKQTFTAKNYDASLAVAYQTVIETIESIAESIDASLAARKLFDAALTRLTRTKYGA